MAMCEQQTLSNLKAAIYLYITQIYRTLSNL